MTAFAHRLVAFGKREIVFPRDQVLDVLGVTAIPSFCRFFPRNYFKVFIHLFVSINIRFFPSYLTLSRKPALE